MSKRNKKSLKTSEVDQNKSQISLGGAIVSRHPIFSGLYQYARLGFDSSGSYLQPDGWAAVDSKGTIYLNSKRHESPEVWAFVIATALTHLAFGHFKGASGEEWNCACDMAAYKFLMEIKIGRQPPGFGLTKETEVSGSVEKIYQKILNERGILQACKSLSIAGINGLSLLDRSKNDKIERSFFGGTQKNWGDVFATGLARAVKLAVEVASDRRESIMVKDGEAKKGNGVLAKEWFLSSFPLLGAMAASFTIIEDIKICQRLSIAIAMVSASDRMIYINPLANLNEEETRFVMAHEILHVALKHENRSLGRDGYLWNVACDYVINNWLYEMKIGSMPPGILFDPTLTVLSAEAIYDKIVTDLRRYKKLATLRGVGACDMIPATTSSFWQSSEGIRLDEFYRGALSQGLEFHIATNRGLLPASFVEEIRSSLVPAIPWDVKLARWFDENFTPIDKKRTYARLSRRQSSSPDIPRPSLTTPEELSQSRTFGVILDTSGSMDPKILGQGLGAIASYAQAKDVSAVRLIFCDAAPYDQGYVEPESILDRVEVKGRGGTRLQPAIDLLQSAKDFPKDGPILIITDGGVEESLSFNRCHAYLLPLGARLPFRPNGEVFFIED